MTQVGKLPSSGLPELSSNTQPTAAMAAIQEPARNALLLGVTGFPCRSQQMGKQDGKQASGRGAQLGAKSLVWRVLGSAPVRFLRDRQTAPRSNDPSHAE